MRKAACGPPAFSGYTGSVRTLTLALSLCLLLSACTWQEVNDYSLIKYGPSDTAGEITLKTAGNLVPWTIEAATAGVIAGIIGGVVLGYLYVAGQSGR